jgi:cysteine-rich repeat protein
MCRIERCGNAVVECMEECDDGNTMSGDGCSATCRREPPPRCGDGRVDPGEQCDDGNAVACDGCTPMCRIERCGNAVVECMEECDDGNTMSGDGCSASCRIEPRCGDGRVTPPEECDDGNASACDGCSVACRVERCGNGLVECMEECDDGNTTAGDGCSPTCRTEPPPPRCGNGIVEPGEMCDLGPMNADRPAIEVEQGGLVFSARIIQRATTASAFYAYVSASAHTGYEALETSNLFVYRDLSTGVLSLFAIHGIDRDTSGLIQPTSDVRFDITDVPAGTTLAISDEPGEFVRLTPTSYRGLWRFANNTDGGVIQGLPLPGSWEIRVMPNFVAGISRFRWVDEPASFTPLDLRTVVIIRAYPTPSACRTDCTVPRCGDGRHDGGEVCDDGNQRDGDGCSADCSRMPG